MRQCVICATETDLLYDIMSRQNSLAKGWFAVLKNKLICSDVCANRAARRESVSGYTIGFRQAGVTKVTESWAL